MYWLRSRTHFVNGYQTFNPLFPQTFVMVLILLVFCLLFFMVGVGTWDLWDPDEPRYAQVASEMVDRGDWVLMHVNGNTYEDKPPLFFWLIAFSSFLWGGFTSFSVRFPSALFGTLTVLLTFLLGKTLYSSRTGFLSGLILATSFEFAYLSTRANIDTTLTFFTTASLLCFFQWYQRAQDKAKDMKNAEVEMKAGEKAKMRNLLIYGFYIGMALATLAKGPVGFVLPLLVSLVYLLFRKEWKTMKRMRLLTGMALLIVIVSSWYLPALLKGGQNFLNETLLHHTLDRFAIGSSHIRPIYYYLANFPVDFLPWVVFLPGAIVYGLSKRKEGISKDFLFLLVWFVVIFLFLSISKGKRAIYLLPLYPAAALLVGKFWNDYFCDSSRFLVREIWISLPVYLFIIIFFLMGMLLYTVPVVANVAVETSTPKILKMIVEGAESATEYLAYVPRWSVIPFIFLLVGSSILLSLAYGLKYKSAVFAIIAVMMGIGFFYATRVIFPLVNPYKSSRFISQDITHIMRPGERLAMYGDFGSGGTAPYNFYTGVVPILEIESEKEMIDFLHRGEKVFCILRYRDYEKLGSAYPGAPLHLITHRGVGHRDIALVSNR